MRWVEFTKKETQNSLFIRQEDMTCVRIKPPIRSPGGLEVSRFVCG